MRIPIALLLSLSIPALAQAPTDSLYKGILNDPTGKMQNDIIQKFSNQKILLGVSWTFGKAENLKQRKVGNLEELSRVGQAK